MVLGHCALGPEVLSILLGRSLVDPKGSLLGGDFRAKWEKKTLDFSFLSKILGILYQELVEMISQDY